MYLLLLSISFRVKGSLLLFLLFLGQVEGGIILSHPDPFLFHSGRKYLRITKRRLKRALATWKFLYASFEGFCCVSITKFRSAYPFKNCLTSPRRANFQVRYPHNLFHPYLTWIASAHTLVWFGHFRLP